MSERIMAHPEDVLLCGRLAERSLHRQFTDRQIITPASYRRLDGRRIWRAYYTDLLHEAPNADKLIETVQRNLARSIGDNELRHVSTWPEYAAADELEVLRLEYLAGVKRIETLLGVQVGPSKEGGVQ